jgi:hypothetical protein
METIDGVVKDDSMMQKGISGTDVFAIEVAKAGLFTKLVEIIGGWLLKDRRRGLKLKIGDNAIEVSDLTNNEQKELIEWFQIQVGINLANKRN